VKFVIDAHLPPGLGVLLRNAGHDVVHTLQLLAQNNTPDRVLNELSVAESRVVITKDSDFFYSHLLLWAALEPFARPHRQRPHTRP
jgi:predicted nuclease of predicted toxin-antitoxin system